MLQSLLIKNYALIERLEWSPSQHFNIITGETGAGKSIILGAIGLLTGDRADTKALLDENEKCIVEGIFDLSGYHLSSVFELHELDYEPIATIRREISPQGKSRAFINDTPVNLETLKDITGSLMDIHSQHDNLLLGSLDFQLSIVDVFADNKLLTGEYRTHFHAYKKLKKQLEYLAGLSDKSKKDFDYESFLLNELSEAKLVITEQEELEKELNVLENAEEIKLKLNQSIQALSEGEFSINTGLAAVIANINQIGKLAPVYENFKERVTACLAELKDLSRELAKEEEKTEADPNRANEIKARLDVMYKLQKKHQAADIARLLEIQTDLEKKVSAYNSVDNQLVDTEKQLNETLSHLSIAAEKITRSRNEVVNRIETNLTELLSELGMPNATFKIKTEKNDFTETGADKINMLFSANKGIEPIALKNAASGGEFSRLMFTLKYLIANKTALPTMVFDEIDTGISGEIAMKMGHMMKKMADAHQIITITHLHQIAARGDAHFYVFKEESEIRTRTQIRKLDQADRIHEIAQMIGGKSPSSLAYESAKELIAN